MQTWMSKRQWFGNSVGLITLLLTLVGLVTIGTHTYELDKLNEYMAYLQVCLSKKQVSLCVFCYANHAHMHAMCSCSEPLSSDLRVSVDQRNT